MKVVGVLLAGGQSRRMGGGDKALRLLGGVTLLDRVVSRLRPQVAWLVLNANGDPARFAGFNLPVVADSVPDFAGPLAGVLAGLDWAAEHARDCPYVASVATDTPFFPPDLVARLVRGLAEAGADLACAASGGRAHPVFGLWPVRLKEELRHAVVADGIRKVDLFTARHKLVTVPFDERPADPFFPAGPLFPAGPFFPADPFFNVNRPEDFAAAAALAAASGTA